jgi:hypothetical protein
MNQTTSWQIPLPRELEIALRQVQETRFLEIVGRSFGTRQIFQRHRSIMIRPIKGITFRGAFWLEHLGAFLNGTLTLNFCAPGDVRMTRPVVL